MYMCRCVCVYVYVYVNMYMFKYMHISMYICICAYIYRLCLLLFPVCACPSPPSLLQGPHASAMDHTGVPGATQGAAQARAGSPGMGHGRTTGPNLDSLTRTPHPPATPSHPSKNRPVLSMSSDNRSVRWTLRWRLWYHLLLLSCNAAVS